MSSIVTTEGIVHYEVDGRGKPIFLLHGWLGSWDVWRNTMLNISELGLYKIYALDFWGFGDSDKRRTPFFNISSYVSMVKQFMDKMGIQQVPVIGHSMGGTVAISLALDHPSRVEKVAVIGSPMVGSSLNLLLKLSGMEWIAGLVWRQLTLLRLGLWLFSPVLAKDGKTVYRMLERDLSQTTLEAFFRSIASLHSTDLRPRLPEVRVPTLGIYGRGDNIVHPGQAQIIAESIPHARVEMLDGSKHFAMLDEPERFTCILQDFLAS